MKKSNARKKVAYSFLILGALILAVFLVNNFLIHKQNLDIKSLGITIREGDYLAIKSNFPDQNFKVCNFDSKRCLTFWNLDKLLLLKKNG